MISNPPAWPLIYMLCTDSAPRCHDMAAQLLPLHQVPQWAESPEKGAAAQLPPLHQVSQQAQKGLESAAAAAAAAAASVQGVGWGLMPPEEHKWAQWDCR
eukprot:scaffold112728_cov20-Tisochrysis_lutea.AAC.1